MTSSFWRNWSSVDATPHWCCDRRSRPRARSPPTPRRGRRAVAPTVRMACRVGSGRPRLPTHRGEVAAPQALGPSAMSPATAGMKARRVRPRTALAAATSCAPVTSRCCTGMTSSRAAWRLLTAQWAARTAATAGIARGIPPASELTLDSSDHLVQDERPPPAGTWALCFTERWTRSSRKPVSPAAWSAVTPSRAATGCPTSQTATPPRASALRVDVCRATVWRPCRRPSLRRRPDARPRHGPSRGSRSWAREMTPSRGCPADLSEVGPQRAVARRESSPDLGQGARVGHGLVHTLAGSM